jgi:hypothetical protein
MVSRRLISGPEGHQALKKILPDTALGHHRDGPDSYGHQEWVPGTIYSVIMQHHKFVLGRMKRTGRIR